MENQHRKISGYRELSQEELDLMNKIKALGPQIQAVVAEIVAHHNKQVYVAYGAGDEDMRDQDEINRLISATPERWKQIGITHLQEGLMALTRSIAQPTFF